ncbi:cytochrome P450 [Lasiosphaeria miniovina]|uniref:Cytochrome P450 n=1 Tax=Lasiosphaeria miniovina TaxID=1954250 RepID=A0AA40AD17_9PEZI|nr:cytochrome P450 [Lasiosphaeria miniovina]KAK0713606.1 cytochrome P450 [Lasiosphaeria miniovina]
MWKEPPAILTGIPFLGPIAGMIREKSRFYIRLRDTYKLSIYTLRLPFIRMHVVNATEPVPTLQKQWRTVSFDAFAADSGFIFGMSKKANELMHHDMTSDNGFMLSALKYILPSVSPGPDLDDINRRAIQILANETDKVRARGSMRAGLQKWTRDIMVLCTSDAVWGPQNTYRDPVVAEAWKTFEAGFFTLAMFPRAPFLFPKLIRAREVVAAALIVYFHRGGHKAASALVRMRFEHHHDMHGFSVEDVARGELGNTVALLANSTTVLADVRGEVSALVSTKTEGGRQVDVVDLVKVTEACPILASPFPETLRCRALNPRSRLLLHDKGSMLMIPAPQRRRPNRVGFRAFGRGHVLCPGRHFASTELMALAALMVLQFDVVPVANGGKWATPTLHNSPVQAGFPVIDDDIDVDIRPRDPSAEWRVEFSGSKKAMNIVSEDISGMVE